MAQKLHVVVSAQITNVGPPSAHPFAGGQFLPPVSLRWATGQNNVGPTTHFNVAIGPAILCYLGFFEHRQE